jgi:hypothetical protein
VTSTRQETPSTHAVDLHYSESGNGEPLVLIMALPSTTGGLALDGRDGGAGRYAAPTTLQNAGGFVLTEALATEWADHGIRLSVSRLVADRDRRVTPCGLKPRLESSVTDAAAMAAGQLSKAAAK